MLSAEPATMRDCGSLNLLATGEICDGDTIHDRQQAHDLVMELAADYDAPIAGGWRWQIYGGIAGEPSLGAVGYSHRPSAADNPMRPITHHWLEAAPSTFGVVTFGLHNQRWKAEASVFNGRAPDEQRSDLDFGKFDSVATRLSFLPSDRLALQISIGRLHEARSEFLRQPQNVDTRAIASATYHRPLESNGLWSTTAAFGVDKARETVLGTTADILSAAALVESTVTLSERHTFFGRIEAAGMPAHHLHAIEFGASVFTVGKVQFGYVRHLGNLKGLVPGLGGSAALSFLPSAFAPRYGGSTAPTFSVFFSLRPVRHAM
jgi:hypothetical protein